MILQFPSNPLLWYALQVRAQREFHIERDLARFKIESYLPTKKRKHWRQLEIEVPLIPGYVFVRATPATIYAALRFNSYFSHIVGILEKPSEIPAVQIETLRLMIAQSEIVVLPLAELWTGGEEVEVIQGPLAGAVGRVAYVRGKARLVVNIEMLGRAVSADVDPADVRAVAPKPLPQEVQLPEAA